ncbi:MAG: hypothetical protein OER96_06105 [Gammaproteobacteria bacterium]|nr:hypothetical protein [Gammaproteobacteria bacterium]
MSQYRSIQRNDWTLSVNTERWRDDWWPCIESLAREHKTDWRNSRHAHSKCVELPSENKVTTTYIKLYKKSGGVRAIKQRVRESKHRRAFRITQELREKGFLVPSIYVCGDTVHDNIYCGLLVTEKLPYIDLSQLPGLLDSLSDSQHKEFKHTLSIALGEQIGKLHNLGYVHGDLVVTNILVDPRNPRTVVFIDHDRSTHSPVLTRKHLQMRNLIQINRHVIDGINHADRLRVFLAYSKARQWNQSRTKTIMREVAKRTVKRRLVREQK